MVLFAGTAYFTVRGDPVKPYRYTGKHKVLIIDHINTFPPPTPANYSFHTLFTCIRPFPPPPLILFALSLQSLRGSLSPDHSPSDPVSGLLAAAVRVAAHFCLRFCCVVWLCRRSSTAEAGEATSCSVFMSLKRAPALFVCTFPFSRHSPPLPSHPSSPFLLHELRQMYW